MRLQRIALFVFCFFIIVAFTGCSILSALNPLPTPTVTPTVTITPFPPTPTNSPTATIPPYYLSATVYSGDLQVPILLYHRFVADYTMETSTAVKMRYSDFTNQLEALYENGFTLIPLKDWLSGDFVVPIGRKPLIFTMDDFWFADQLFLEDDGMPSIYSGIGILWEFSKNHPEFGFSVAVFSNMGDKYYADKHVEDFFFIGDDDTWKTKLGQTIAWAIENGVDPYNHLWKHPLLPITNTSDIQEQIAQNDLDTRYFLNRAGRSDLFPELGNIIALPFGQWPATVAGVNILKNYKDPEGQPVAAIMEAYNLDAAQLTDSVFSEGFDHYSVPRITASNYMVQFVIDNKDKVPTAMNCQIGPLDEQESSNIEVLTGLIGSAVSNSTCPPGVYNINGNVFVARDGTVSVFKLADSNE
jgi:hypothetical protein